jgi:hypothetical protein
VLFRRVFVNYNGSEAFFPALVAKPMPNILKNMGDKLPSSVALRRAGFLAWRELRGLAKDFWYDGNWTIPDDIEEVEPPPKKKTPPKSARRRLEEEDGLWHALAGEVSEKMWGKHCVTPGDEHITEFVAVARPATGKQCPDSG